MSNVHTLGSLNRENEDSAGPAYSQMGSRQSSMGMAPQDEESKEAVQMFGSLTGSGGNSIGKPPRKENYWDMWKSTFCP